jgi:hypothetical protein
MELPLVHAAQSQKHVTVNEALARLDALAQLRVIASDIVVPPATEADGASYLVPTGAGGDWAGKAGKIAIWSNGGWVFVSAKVGWKAWDVATFAHKTYNGSEWIDDAVAVTPGGAATILRVLEFDHAIAAGAQNLTSIPIPSHAQVVGVTGRVTQTIQGAGLTGWRLGVESSDNRYASGLGLSVNSYLVGLSGQPVTYYEETPLKLTAQGGDFMSGSVRLAVHLVQLVPPREV